MQGLQLLKCSTPPFLCLTHCVFILCYAAGTKGRGREGSMEPIFICLQIPRWSDRFIVLCSCTNLHVAQGPDRSQGTTYLECCLAVQYYHLSVGIAVKWFPE